MQREEFPRAAREPAGVRVGVGACQTGPGSHGEKCRRADEDFRKSARGLRVGSGGSIWHVVYCAVPLFVRIVARLARVNCRDISSSWAGKVRPQDTPIRGWVLSVASFRVFLE